MPGHQEHPLDRPLAAMVKALENADQQMAQMSKNLGDFDAKELTPEEDELLFAHPALRYPGETNPDTGLPYTNAQAAQRLHAEMGDEQYVQYVDDFVRRADRRADRRAKEGQPDATSADNGMEMAVGSGPDPGASPGASPADGPLA